MMMDLLKVSRLRPNAVLPQRATSFSAGYDLYACIEKPVLLPARCSVLIQTGIALEIGRQDVAAFIFARSGLAIRHGLVPSNAVGVIDADYRGEIMVSLTNHSDSDYTIQPGERIAQMILMPVLTPELVLSDRLEDTERGSGGFGSTGRM